MEGAGVRRYVCAGVPGAIGITDALLDAELCTMDGFVETTGEGLLLLASIRRAAVMKRVKKRASF